MRFTHNPGHAWSRHIYAKVEKAPKHGLNTEVALHVFGTLCVPFKYARELVLDNARCYLAKG